MKKLIPLLVIAAGAAAYLLNKKKKETEPEEVKMITLTDEDEPKEEENKITEVAQNYSLEVAQINIRFPYLKPKFIEETLSYGANFADEYPEGTQVEIHHVAKFHRVEDLIAFVKSCKENDVDVKEAQEENTILAVNHCIVAANTILDDVFNIANQVYCLEGDYFGFRIDKA